MKARHAKVIRAGIVAALIDINAADGGPPRGPIYKWPELFLRAYLRTFVRRRGK